MVKIAPFAPIPSASVRIATIVKPRLFLSMRTPNFTSCQRVPTEPPSIGL
jgi:hypothetical protein